MEVVDINRSQSIYRWSSKAAGYTAAFIGISITAVITFWLLLAALAGYEMFIAVVLRLALLTISLVVLLVAANIGQKLVDNRRTAQAAVHKEQLTAVVLRLVADPADPAIRTTLGRHLDDLETMRAIGDELPPEEQETLIGVLNEMDAGRACAEDLASALGKWSQVRAALLLGWLSTPKYTSALRKALVEPDDDVALAAAQALANLNTAEAYEALVAALESGYPDRMRLVSLMEASLFSENAEIFERELAKSAGPVRYWIAYLLRQFSDPPHLEILFELTSDDDPDIRARAAESLGEIGDASFGPVLDRLLSDPYWFVRAQAATAVGRCGIRELAPSLLPMLRDEQWWVRQDAALALKRLGRQVAPAVEPMLSDEDRFARNKAAEILIDLGIVQDKIADLDATGPRSEEAADFLVAIGRAQAVNVLHEKIVRARPQTTLAMIDILRRIGDMRSIPVLESLSNDRQPDVARTAAEAAEALSEQSLSA